MLGALEAPEPEPEEPAEEPLPDDPGALLPEDPLDDDPPALEGGDFVAPPRSDEGLLPVALPELPVPELPWPCLLLLPGHPSMLATSTAPAHAIHLPRIERM